MASALGLPQRKLIATNAQVCLSPQNMVRLWVCLSVLKVKSAPQI